LKFFLQKFKKYSFKNNDLLTQQIHSAISIILLFFYSYRCLFFNTRYP